MNGRSPFAVLVRRLRREANMTQDALAAQLGVTRSTISQIENGKNLHPGRQILLGLERALGIDRNDALMLIGRGYDEEPVEDWKPDPGDTYGLPPASLGVIRKPS